MGSLGGLAPAETPRSPLRVATIKDVDDRDIRREVALLPGHDQNQKTPKPAGLILRPR